MARGTRRRGKRGGSYTFLILGLVGGGVALLVLGGLVVLGLSGTGPLGSGLLGNSRVTPANYDALATGATLAQVEAILGPGRAPSANDFDAICGTEREAFTNPYFRERTMWEHYASQGQILVWSNGKERILVFFHKSAVSGGQLVRKVMQEADGSINSQSGGTVPVNPTGGKQMTISNPALAKFDPNQPIRPADKFTYTLAELLDECKRDPNMVRRLGGQRVKVTGTFQRTEENIFAIMGTPDGTGRAKAHISEAATAILARKKPGDTVTLTGVVGRYLSIDNLLVMANCDVE